MNISPLCPCGKTALYRVGHIGYCKQHRADAIAQIEKFGNPRNKTLRTAPKVKVRHVAKVSSQQFKLDRQKAMIAAPTPSEAALRIMLRANPITRGKWKFQPILHGYIPDFLNTKAGVIVELDGAPHFTAEGKRADARRSRHLMRHGYRVIRFSNHEVFTNPDGVMAFIMAAQDGTL